MKSQQGLLFLHHIDVNFASRCAEQFIFQRARYSVTYFLGCKLENGKCCGCEIVCLKYYTNWRNLERNFIRKCVDFLSIDCQLKSWNHCYGFLTVRKELVSNGKTLTFILKCINKEPDRTCMILEFDLLSKCVAGLNYDQMALTELLKVVYIFNSLWSLTSWWSSIQYYPKNRFLLCQWRLSVYREARVWPSSLPVCWLLYV